MNSVRKTLMLVAGAALLLGLTVMSVAAAPNGDTTTATTDDPAMAKYINGSPMTVAPNSAMWVKFAYSAAKNDDGSRNNATVSIANLTSPNIGFEVFTPDQLGSWPTTDPIGRGSAKGILCSPIDADWVYTCQTYSLGWVGKFNTSGDYYVRVTNDNGYPVTLTVTESE